MYLKKNFNIIIFSLLYSSLLIGFFFGEDLNRGAKPDFYSYIDSAQATNRSELNGWGANSLLSI